MSMIGKTLAHYEIASQLGKGGMGKVYQAKDRKLGRDAAIKVLPEEFAKDADRVLGFRREAKLFASLKHQTLLPYMRWKYPTGDRDGEGTAQTSRFSHPTDFSIW
jgi:serine/threonine protein kinase